MYGSRFKLVGGVLCPIRKVKVKKTHYRCLLMMAAGGIWMVHCYCPDYEMHVTFATNLLFAFDPTV